MDKCREGFEAIAKELDLDCEWVDLTGITVFDGASGKKKDGCYNDFTTDTAWGFYRIQQAKVEELQEEFAEDERFLKEQIQQKDLEISNLKYLQGMDKDLIQTLQGNGEKLQKRVDVLEQVLKEANEIVDLNIETVERIRDKAKDMQDRNYSVSMLYLLKPIRRVLEQALKGENNEE